jgi:tetratricopeptide (TPR) repeat protein
MEHPDSIVTSSKIDYWSPGNYKIKRIIKNYPSNILEISINEPAGDEKEALKMYKTAIDLKKVDRDSAVKKFWELIEQYPKSVYFNSALNKIRLNYYHANKLESIKKGMETGKKILEKFPDIRRRGNVLYLIRRYYKKINDLEGAKEYFKKLYHTTKSAKLKKSAKLIIKQIEEGKF